MAEQKEENNTGLGLGEISTIRNILMGQQMNEYEQRFGHLEEKLTTASGQQTSDLKAFQTETTRRLNEMENEINERFDKLEKMLREGLENLRTQNENSRKNDNAALGRMLGDIGRKLGGE